MKGFTMFELLVAMALIAILSGIGIPTLMEANRRNQVWTASELIGSQIRQARLKAISRNMSFRVRFNCPEDNQFRLLQVTGNTAIDNAVNRCSTYQTYDSGVMAMPAGVSFGTPDTLTVNSRGVFSSTGAIPSTITVSGLDTSRSLTMSATGKITFDIY